MSFMQLVRAGAVALAGVGAVKTLDLISSAADETVALVIVGSLTLTCAAVVIWTSFAIQRRGTDAEARSAPSQPPKPSKAKIRAVETRPAKPIGPKNRSGALSVRSETRTTPTGARAQLDAAYRDGDRMLFTGLITGGDVRRREENVKHLLRHHPDKLALFLYEPQPEDRSGPVWVQLVKAWAGGDREQLEQRLIQLRKVLIELDEEGGSLAA